MFRSNWGKRDAIVALVVCLFILIPPIIKSVYKATNQQNEYQARNSEETYNQNNLNQGYIAPFVSSEDTLAQWIMAIFTIVMAVTAALGAWWVRGTLITTREAVRAADDAVAETRRIGQAQTRAYISVCGVEIEKFTPQKKTCLIVVVQNLGQTPAYIFNIEARILFTNESGVQFGGKTECFERSDKEYAIPFNSKEPMRLSSREFSIPAPEGIAYDDAFLVIAGIIEYTDVFRSKQFTKFEYRASIKRMNDTQIMQFEFIANGSRAS